MITATRIAIMPNTELLMLTAEFAGYTLEEALLGTMSAGEYAQLANSDNDGGKKAIAGLCELLDNYHDDGSVWLRKNEKRKAAAAKAEAGSYMELEWFTPRTAHAQIMAMAERESSHD